jgi:hypothetical protein
MTENTKDRFEGINRSSRTTETREKNGATPSMGSSIST